MVSAPTDDQILDFLRHHSLPADAPVERSPHEGVVNHVRMVGDLCIRILKAPDYASDIWTESVAVPAVREAGALVPELLLFDSSETILPSLVTVYRRFEGEPLGQLRSVKDIESIYREIGEQIALWREKVRRVNDPNGRLDKPELPNPRQTVAINASRLSQAELRWVDGILARLESAKVTKREFIHWDLHTHNVLVADDRVSAILDWGDAGWGDAAINYHCLPAEWLPTMLAKEDMEDADFVGRCLLGIVLYALNDVHRPEDAIQPYRNGGHRRWRSLLRLCRSNVSEPFRHWLGAGEVPGN